jgi:hypothetical protein
MDATSIRLWASNPQTMAQKSSLAATANGLIS